MKQVNFLNPLDNITMTDYLVVFFHWLTPKLFLEKQLTRLSLLDISLPCKSAQIRPLLFVVASS